MNNKLSLLTLCALSVSILMPLVISAKSLEEYGILNERLFNVLEKEGISKDASIDTIFDSEENEDSAITFYGNLFSEIRKEDDLTKIQKLTEVYVQGINTHAEHYVLKRMWKPPFYPESFNEAAKQTLANPDGTIGFYSHYVRALGIAQIGNDQINLKKYIEGKTVDESLQIPSILGDSDFYRFQSASWAARVVLARRGDQVALDGILEKVEPMSELDVGAHTSLLLDFGYVRQPETIDLLIDVLFSKLGTPEKPYPEKYQDIWSMPYAYGAVRPLALAFDDFPIDFYKSLILPEDLELAREYIRNYQKSAELEITSPPVVAEVTEEAIELEPGIKEPAEVAAVELAEESPEEPGNWLLWLIGTLVVLGGLIVVVRRKN